MHLAKRRVRVPKLAIKIRNSEVTIEAVINTLLGKDAALKRVKEDAIDIILGNLQSLDSSDTPTRAAAMTVWKQAIDNRGQAVPAPNLSPAKDWLRFDDANRAEMFENIRITGDGITIGNVSIPRKYEVSPAGTSADHYEDNAHVVNYVACHLKGFDLYSGKHDNVRFNKHIEGRDLMYTALLMSLKEIRELLIDELTP